MKQAGLTMDRETEEMLYDLRITRADVLKALESHNRYNVVAARVAKEARIEEIPG